ncbi:hypothetical protein EJ02DRAFT_516710 [Clathrospora elynae]|uniref:Uncharacterized protein n=1 Tax=Clathrospora elynae TaxID=706981 RepID=A0A6A5S631_9PLEO|nr:hypothetical protein EJ02DRAFT_516710 [Clathrospora elynae]
MPPRKQKPTKQELRALIREHGIRFKGPIPQKQWPERYAHHFQTIHEISRVWYDEYKSDSSIPKERRRAFKKRVNHLGELASRLLDDVNTNESTWREFEPYVLQRFDERVICEQCHNDVWRSDYEASSLRSQAELKAKRSGRRLCLCRSGRLQVVADDTDGENSTIFDFAKEQALSHASNDNLDYLSISMKPDRVVGLRSPVRIPNDPSLFPVTGRDILLPFLVIEAKKEQDAPGFRAIQCQTAFAVRRLLMAQESLLKDNPADEPCLIWFFAFQGEQWRLQICTYDDSKSPVKVYDLWEGTVQRQDDALQLLLIVDYIWSWARDIYRPSVRKAVYESILADRDISPASTDRFRQSLSLCSAPTPVAEPDEFDTMQIDHGSETDALSGLSPSVSDAEDEDFEQIQGAALQQANNHKFLRWAVGHQAAPSWTKFGSIRHSNIIQFEFQISTGHWLDLESTIAGFSSTTAMQSAFLLRSEQLLELVALWVPHAEPPPSLSFAGSECVSILSYTRFDQLTWQIKRGLVCILWQRSSSETVLTAGNMHQVQLLNSILERPVNPTTDLKRALLDVQQISGRTSVWYALKIVTMLLSQKQDGIKWMLAHEPISGTEAIYVAQTSKTFEHQTIVKQMAIPASPRNRQISGDQLERHPSYIIPALLQDTRTGDSMIVVRSDSWSEECPKFCLFVLLDEYVDDYRVLHRLLEEARTRKNFYGDHDCKLSRSDWQNLRNWSKALRDGA